MAFAHSDDYRLPLHGRSEGKTHGIAKRRNERQLKVASYWRPHHVTSVEGSGEGLATCCGNAYTMQERIGRIHYENRSGRLFRARLFCIGHLLCVRFNFCGRLFCFCRYCCRYLLGENAEAEEHSTQEKSHAFHRRFCWV